MFFGDRYTLSSNKADNYLIISSVESQKGAINIEEKNIPLRTRRALSQYTLYSENALLVLNITSSNIDSALLALNWRYVVLKFSRLCVSVLDDKV